MRILVIEDEIKVADFIASGLSEHGHGTETVYSGAEGCDRALKGGFDIVILDIMLPEMDGFRILERLRAAQPDTRVLILSALDNTRNKIEALNLGADDYLTKPFDFDELLARVHALSRRGRLEQCDHYEISDLIVNTRTQHVERAGKRIELSAREFMLLKFLLEHKDEIVTRTMIAQHVWNLGFEGETNIIDVYINYLRRKLGDGEGNRLIHTIRGRGYILSEAP